MADERPTDVDFLSLTQSGVEVSGYLLVVTPDGNMSTKSTTIPLNGSADGDVVTLNNPSTQGVYTLRRSDNKLTLSYPSTKGQIGSRTLTPTSQEEFNNLLYTWQADLSTQKQFAEDFAAKSKNLGDWINYIEYMTGTFNKSIESLRNILFQGLWSEASDIQGIRDALDQEKEEAAVRPMTCWQTTNVAFHYNSNMKYYYDQLGDHQDSFAKEVSSLETSLDQVAGYIAETQEAAKVLDEAIKNIPYSIDMDGPWPGDEITPISNYQAAADAARSQLSDLKETDAANQTTADSLMAEGKSVLDDAEALVNCPP
ncbi:MAG: hypothetical protein WCD37_09525 [Chloroflexia bacterium]